MICVNFLVMLVQAVRSFTAVIAEGTCEQSPIDICKAVNKVGAVANSTNVNAMVDLLKKNNVEKAYVFGWEDHNLPMVLFSNGSVVPYIKDRVTSKYAICIGQCPCKPKILGEEVKPCCGNQQPVNEVKPCCSNQQPVNDVKPCCNQQPVNDVKPCCGNQQPVNDVKPCCNQQPVNDVNTCYKDCKYNGYNPLSFPPTRTNIRPPCYQQKNCYGKRLLIRNENEDYCCTSERTPCSNMCFDPPECKKRDCCPVFPTVEYSEHVDEVFYSDEPIVTQNLSEISKSFEYKTVEGNNFELLMKEEINHCTEKQFVINLLENKLFNIPKKLYNPFTLYKISKEIGRMCCAKVCLYITDDDLLFCIVNQELYFIDTSNDCIKLAKVSKDDAKKLELHLIRFAN